MAAHELTHTKMIAGGNRSDMKGEEICPQFYLGDRINFWSSAFLFSMPVEDWFFIDCEQKF